MATVGFVANHLERGGGLELYELAMAEGLHSRGWDVLVAYEHDGDLSERWRAVASTIEMFEGEQLPPMLKQADVLYVHPTSVIPLVGRFGAAQQIPVVAHLHLPPESLRTGWKALVRGRRRSGHPEAEHARSRLGDQPLPCRVRPHGGAVAALRLCRPNGSAWSTTAWTSTDSVRPATKSERRPAASSGSIQKRSSSASSGGSIRRRASSSCSTRSPTSPRGHSSGEVVLAVLGEASRHSGGAASPYTAGLVARQVPWRALARAAGRPRTHRALLRPAGGAQPMGRALRSRRHRGHGVGRCRDRSPAGRTAGDLRRSVPGPAGGADGAGTGDSDSTDDRGARSVADAGACQPRSRRVAILPDGCSEGNGAPAVERAPTMRGRCSQRCS